MADQPNVTPKRSSTANELLDSLTASLGDWLGVDGHHYTVTELREAIERPNHTPNNLELERVRQALAQLLHEVIMAGFESATDYNWPKAISDAKAALGECDA